MASFVINNVSLRGIAACVPALSASNLTNESLSTEESKKFIQTTAVENRRVAASEICTSDLCYEAAEKLISDLKWDKNEINVLVFVSQTGDYLLPVTSALLQDRLKLSTECMAIDVPLGCSGYIYGISVLASILNSTGLKKGLLLAGDTISKIVSAKDKSTQPLFGDAGTATALEYDNTASPLKFDLGTDGAGYKAIIVNDGGARNPVTNQSLEEKEYGEGIYRNNCQLSLDGMDVFSFGISQTPKTVNNLLSKFNIDKETVDYFIFHQANMMMNKMIAKKLKLPEEKVPYSLKNFGNTSSATIPLTILTELKEQMRSPSSLILCGFGIGLSWGTLFIEKASFHCSDLIEI